MSNRLYPRAVTSTPDFDISDFGSSGAWQADGLDLSAIVPSGATSVYLMFRGKSSSAADVMGLRTNATTKSENKCHVYVQEANVYSSMVHAIIQVDSDRKLDYYIAANFDAFDLWVTGWEIDAANYSFVPRSVTSTPDFDQEDLWAAGAWAPNNFNLSAIVPAGAVAVALLVDFSSSPDALQTDQLRWRGNATTKNAESCYIGPRGDGIVTKSHMIILQIDSDRLVDQWFEREDNTLVKIWVIGWWI